MLDIDLRVTSAQLVASSAAKFIIIERVIVSHHAAVGSYHQRLLIAPTQRQIPLDALIIAAPYKHLIPPRHTTPSLSEITLLSHYIQYGSSTMAVGLKAYRR